MRFLKKYKFWIKNPDTQPPLRLAKFKRSKWKKVKKFNFFRRKFFLFNKNPASLRKSNKIIWKRLKFSYKNNLLFKLKYRCRFDFSVPLKSIKFLTKKSEALSYNLLRFEYKLDVLLWKLKFFKSTFHARQAIQKGIILLNNNILTSTQKYLNQGDILRITNLNIPLNKSLTKKEIKNSFLEIDYYTKTLVIIKSFNILSLKDFSLAVQDLSFTDYAINNLRK